MVAVPIFSAAFSNALIAQFASDPDCTTIYIGTNPSLNGGPKITRLQSDHEDHFHVQYRDPD